MNADMRVRFPPVTPWDGSIMVKPSALTRKIGVRFPGVPRMGP